MEQKIYWHLPGLCYFRTLNLVLLNTMKDYPEKFRENYAIGSVYGTIPGAIWNGGRAVFGSMTRPEVERVVEGYNSKGIPVRFTWTNSMLEEKHMADTYCNMIMRVADNGKNQVLVNRPCLEEYIRENYPSYSLMSSTTKRMLSLEQYVEELKKDYGLVVLDYDMNHDEAVLEAISGEAHRVEILVNEICYPNCPKRSEHYLDESRLQLEFDTRTTFACPNKSKERRNFEECKKRPTFLSNEDVEAYIARGFRNFKIVGRGLPMDFVLDSYIYFLVKDEEQGYIRNHICKTLDHLNQQMKRKG